MVKIKSKVIFMILSCVGFLFFSNVWTHAQDIPSDSLTNALADFSQLDDNQKSSVLESLGVPPNSGQINLWNIMSYFIFGGIGFVAFIYGKKNALWKPMVAGIILNIYPYFVSSTLLIYLIGGALVAALFVWRD